MIAAPTLASVKTALRIDDDLTELDDHLSRQITAATALANRQAPDAPAEIGHEAIIRAVAWMHEGTYPGDTDAGLWRRCGAAGLLAPWTVRRAGAIG